MENDETKPMMTEEKPAPKASGPLSVPASIILAGVIVAIAIVYTNAPSKQAPTPAAPTAGAPTAQAPTTQGSGTLNFRPVSSSDHVRGDLSTAKVTIIEYSDLQCPFCQSFHPTMNSIMGSYQGQVAWVYRHFPLRQLHEHAEEEAEASECAAEQGGNDAFWKFIDRVFATEPQGQGMDTQGLISVASYIGLDQQAFSDCLSSGRFAQKVSADEQDAIAAGGLGTPYSIAVSASGKTFPINGALPITQVKSIVDQALAAN